MFLQKKKKSPVADNCKDFFKKEERSCTHGLQFLMEVRRVEVKPGSGHSSP